MPKRTSNNAFRLHFHFQSEQLEQQIHELTATIESHKSNNTRLQSELKSAIDKIYDLREIITELEVKLNEKNQKLRVLEIDMNDTTTANESLHHEVESLKTQTETAPIYEETIKELEEQIRSLQPNAEQSAVIERIADHLREIEENLDRKTNLLESIHVMHNDPPTSCSTPSEDVSIRGSAHNLDGATISPRNFKYLARDPAFPIEQILRITEKLQKHTKVEEAAIKRVRDLEMQLKALHNTYVVSTVWRNDLFAKCLAICNERRRRRHDAYANRKKNSNETRLAQYCIKCKHPNSDF